MRAWKVGLSLAHRKRSLLAAAKGMSRHNREGCALRCWMRYTYYKHIAHVALHFRIRRLACVVLRQWRQVGGCRSLHSPTPFRVLSS